MRDEGPEVAVPPGTGDTCDQLNVPRSAAGSGGPVSWLTRRHLTGLTVILAAVFIPVLGAVGPVGGHPTTPDPPVPPAAGSCVIQTPTGTNQVACDAGTSGVVVHSWARATIGPDAPTAADQCDPWVQRYLDEIHGVPNSAGAFVAYTFGPGNRWIHGWSWSACVFTSLAPG